MNSSIMYPSLVGMILPAMLYLAGIVLSVIWWSRSPRSFALVLGASIILLATAIIQPVTTQFIARNRTSGASIAQTFAQISAVFSIVRTVALGLLMAAAFTDRPLPTSMVGGFEPLPPSLPRQ